MAKLDATGHRWVATLANYNFDIYYKSRKTNVGKDVLSRISWDECNKTKYVLAIIFASIQAIGSPIEAYVSIAAVL